MSIETMRLKNQFILIPEYVKAQKRNQSPRAGPSSRALGANPRTSSSSSIEFDCPEEFGYYPHPTDCSQYYVCVFGGALLESCTGGLMYSHELQTCDWPRNVGCEVAEVSGPAAVPAPREVTPRVPAISSRVRYSSNQEQSQQQQHQHQQQQHQQQHIQQQPSAPAHIQQIQTIPPPPELRIAPNPIITSRGQPKDEIIKVRYPLPSLGTTNKVTITIHFRFTLKHPIHCPQPKKKNPIDKIELAEDNREQLVKCSSIVTEFYFNPVSMPSPLKTKLDHSHPMPIFHNTPSTGK